MIKLESFLEKPLSRFIIWCLIGLSIMFFGILNVKADIIDSNRGFYWFTNSSSGFVGNTYVEGNNKFTIPRNSRVSAWWVDFEGNNFSFISGQTYTGYLYFTFNDVDYSWVVGDGIELTVNCVDAPGNPSTCTNYITSFTSAYVSGSSDVVIEFDFIAPQLNLDDIIYISLNNTNNNEYALGYAVNNTVTVNFNKFSYYISSGTISPGENVIIDQNQTIINQNQQTNEELSDINDNLTNSDVNGVENSFEQFEGFLEDNSTITQLITLPITLYTSILNNVGGTCQPFNLGSLYGEELVLPCVNIGNYLGSTLWGMIDLIISGFSVYFIAKKLIKVFNTFSSMKEGDVIDD